MVIYHVIVLSHCEGDKIRLLISTDVTDSISDFEYCDVFCTV